MPPSQGGERMATAAAQHAGHRPEGMQASENQTSHMGKLGRGTGGGKTHSETQTYSYVFPLWGHAPGIHQAQRYIVVCLLKICIST